MFPIFFKGLHGKVVGRVEQEHANNYVCGSWHCWIAAIGAYICSLALLWNTAK
jgi:hypothetical protein